MNVRRPLPSGLDPQGFRVREGLAAGASRQRLRRSDLSSPFFGIRMVGSVETDISRLRALASAFPAGTGFAGRTAAGLWDLPLPTSSDRRLCVSAPAPARALRRKGVAGRVHSVGTVVLRDAIPLLDPESTWLSLASDLEQYDLTAVADRLISKGLKTPAPSTRAKLQAALEAYGPRRGARTLRRALDDARENVRSRPETLLRLLIVRAGLPEPEPNHATYPHGELALIDLAWPAIRLGLEYEGFWHDLSRGQREKDAHRRQRLADDGWTLIEVRKQDLFGAPHALVARIVDRRSRAGAAPARAIETTNLPRFAP